MHPGANAIQARPVNRPRSGIGRCPKAERGKHFEERMTIIGGRRSCRPAPQATPQAERRVSGRLCIVASAALEPWTARRSHPWGSTLLPTLRLSLFAWGTGFG
jgi:hypothetical protein